MPVVRVLGVSAQLPGQPVVITGTGFTSASTVAFGGVAATSVTYHSPTSLTVVVPAGVVAGNNAVMVTTSGSSSNTSSSPALEVLQVYRTPTASGCVTSASVTVDGTGGPGVWRYLRLGGAGGAAIAAIEDTYNLGTVSIGFLALGTGTTAPVRTSGSRAYLDRNFYLVATNQNFPGTSIRVRFFGLSSEIDRLRAVDGNATATTLKVSQYGGPNEDCDLSNNTSTAGSSRLVAAPATVVSGTDWFTAQVTVTDHFSEFYLTGASSPLPVELAAFTATPAGNSAVRLAWATASEQNSDVFEVERSLDGKAFERLGTVAAAGSSSAPRSYAFEDNQVPKSPCTTA